MTTARSAIKILRRFHILMRRTTISHFSFLISNSSEAFIHNQGGVTPHGLTLNPEPANLHYLSQQLMQGSMVKMIFGTSARSQPCSILTRAAILQFVGVRRRKRSRFLVPFPLI